MNFVKSSVYLQEITASGVHEKEVDTRDPEERNAYERLRKLPEFTTDPNYKSLAEQLQENEQMQYPEASDDPYPYAPSRLTVEDAEFFEQLEREALRRKQLVALHEELELQEFRSQMKTCCTPPQPEEEEAVEHTVEDAYSSLGGTHSQVTQRPSVHISIRKGSCCNLTHETKHSLSAEDSLTVNSQEKNNSIHLLLSYQDDEE